MYRLLYSGSRSTVSVAGAGLPPPNLSSTITTFMPLWSKPVVVTCRCNSISTSQTQSHRKDEELIKRRDNESIWEDTREREDVGGLVKSVAAILKSIDDGNISASPYDTAWVALLPSQSNPHIPRFPMCLEWISMNQLGDGSWGDPAAFSIYDRILNTLACVIAFKMWRVHSRQCQNGIAFIEMNIDKLDEEHEDQMPIGFEIAFPSLIEIAQQLNLNLEISRDSPAISRIYLQRDLKLTRIPHDVMHRRPTTLLHSLEGMPGLKWEMLLKLQSADGSFLFSPSSTAYALRHTGDSCSEHYLATIVNKFHGGVPNVYPVDLFERLWAVDRLERLGISRYFATEIDACIDYVYRHWTERGICWARNSEVEDIDDTAVGFRLLRMHGRDVSPAVFTQFESGGEFVCFAGQSTQAVTGMYNLYRAAQLAYPGEELLAEAANFAGNFLRDRRARDDLVDKWIITKDLPGEVSYALDVPWYASLPRLESRFYLEQYGGQNDVWIGKTLYRMPNVNNNTYLELAKLDYNKCQTLHRQEWDFIKEWYKKMEMGELRLSEERLMLAYYTSAASIFEPEKSETRLGWAKTLILIHTLRKLSPEKKRAFLDDFQPGNMYKTRTSVTGKVMMSLNEIALNVMLDQDRDIFRELYRAWMKWFKALQDEGEDMGKGDVELSIRTITLIGNNGGGLSEKETYQLLLEATADVCHQIRSFHPTPKTETNGGGCNGMTTPEIEEGMRKLVQLVYTRSLNDIDLETKQQFLMVAKSVYYGAYFSQETIDSHIQRVLFQRVV